MRNIQYGTAAGLDARELTEFYGRLRHEIAAQPKQVQQMLTSSAAFVTARDDGRLIGIARGLSDGMRGYLTECKLDPAYQGEAAITRKDGRIEHDQRGIAGEMARRVLAALAADGLQRIDVLAWGTEVDFCEELGFQKSGGMVGLTMPASACHAFLGEPATV
jgi:hypothetical protein